MVLQWPSEKSPWTEKDVIKLAKNTSHDLGIPPRLLLALLIAESGLKWNSSRFALRNADGSFTNLTQAANRAIADRDEGTFRSLLATITERGSTDISFGVGQQTVRWATEGDHTQSAENVLYIRDLYFDPVHAVFVAGTKIRGYKITHGDDLEALCRYNKPLIAGKNNPARANYERALVQADAMLSEGEPGFMQVLQKRTGNIAGTFTQQPLGFILHGSRSGKVGNPKNTEALGCANWCINNPDGLGWHASIGEDLYYVHMNANQWGWNARGASDNYVAVEFAQGVVQEPITDGQVRAFVHFVQHQILPTYPNIPITFVTHADIDGTAVYGGQRDGKTDVFPKNDPRTAELIARINSDLHVSQPEPQNPTDYAFHFGFDAKAKELGKEIAGEPLENETYISENYSLQMTSTGLMIYSKTANRVHFLKGL